MSIFGLFFIIIIIILVLGLSVISSIIRFIFGLGKRRDTGNTQSQPNTSQGARGNTVNDPAPEKRHKKIFDKSEGEYVEFEEIDEGK